MPLPDRLVVSTPWYPNTNNPFAGAFVQAQVEALHPLIPRIDVVHTSDWATPAGRVSAKIVKTAFTRLVSGPGRRIDVVPPDYTDGVRLTRIPTMVTPARDYAEWSRTHERTARDALAGRVLADAPLIHAHVGSYGGWIATALGRSDARVVVTEHASFLNRILAQPAAREMYGQVMVRADVVTVVSNVLGRVVTGAFPQHAGKVVRIGNIVHVDRFPARERPVADLRRWLYVGAFTQHKGVRQVLEAFAVVALERGDTELTLVGHGPLEDALRTRVSALGLEERVHMVPSLPPEEIPAIMSAHDLLVHNSIYETFGLTVAEAVAAGTPVLVTRCGGPQETLEDIGPQAGELIEVSDGVLELIAGYRRLSARLDELDPVAARASIEARFGPKAVAAALLAAYDGTSAPGEQGNPA
jgi:glycogen(starch) synthase